MTDVTQGAEASADAPIVANIQAIPIVKVNGATVDVDFDALPIEIYKEMLFLGAKEYINKVGMSKIGAGLTKLEGAELDKAHKAINDQAQKNVDAMTTGNGFKFHGAKSETKVSGAVQTEAMRLAKNMVKDWMKANGHKISHTPASEITAGSKVVLANDPSIYKTAEANLEARLKAPVKGIDLAKIIKADPELVKKAEAAKASKKKGKGEGQLSAKQAGLVAPRSKPKPGTSATAH